MFNAMSLNELIEQLRALRTDLRSQASMDDLPTFGGEEPECTLGVWSWDEHRLLVGDGWDDLIIVRREDW
jgi:hypothetical protein